MAIEKCAICFTEIKGIPYSIGFPRETYYACEAQNCRHILEEESNEAWHDEWEAEEEKED